jgi:hypothetical protein
MRFIINLFLVCFFIFINNLVSSAQNSFDDFDWARINLERNYENLNWDKVPRDLSKEMVAALLEKKSILSLPRPFTLLKLEERVIVLVPCTFHVLIWNGFDWENLYKGDYSGFNCLAKFFVHNDRLYSLGNYGFWNGHSELLEFDFESGGWENVKAKNMPVNYGGGFSFLIKDKIVSIFGNYIRQSTGIHEFEENGYHYDFLKNIWASLKVEMSGKSMESIKTEAYFDLKDFVVIPYRRDADVGHLVIDKTDLSIYFIKRGISIFDHYQLAFGNGNRVVVFDEIGNQINLSYDNLNLKKIGSIILDNSRSNYEPNKFLLFALLVIVIIFCWVIFINGKLPITNFLNKTLNKGDIVAENPNIFEIKQIIAVLLSYENQQIDVHQLDELLGLKRIQNLDYRRVRRSRIIKAVNEFYFSQNNIEMIHRSKDVNDKRVIFYTIFGKH